MTTNGAKALDSIRSTPGLLNELRRDGFTLSEIARGGAEVMYAKLAEAAKHERR